MGVTEFQSVYMGCTIWICIQFTLITNNNVLLMADTAKLSDNFIFLVF